MLADLHIEHDGIVMLARLEGDVDMSNADDIGGAVVRALTNVMHALVIDLTGVGYFDSAGIRLVYDLRERLAVRGQTLRLVVPEVSPVRDALRLAAVLQSVEVDTTLADAHAALAET